MSAVELTAYAAELRDRLRTLGAASEDLDRLIAAAQQLSVLMDGGPVTELAWRQAVAEWEKARSKILRLLGKAMLGALADIPLLQAFLDDLESLARTGLRAKVTVGPLHLSISSATLYVKPPPPLVGLIPVGPFQVGAIEACIVPPFGGGSPALPGGGSLARLSGPTASAGAHGSEAGWGGRLQIPLPPVQVSASAVLNVEGGQPSFLAVLGVQFVPPLQLSFGFSLDRVGGLVGVNRRIDTDALRSAVRTGEAGDALFLARPPDNPAVVANQLDRLFPRSTGTHLIGPSLKISWLSLGPAGSLISMDLAMPVEIPSGRVSLIGVARMGIPGNASLFAFRLDLMGALDPVEQLLTVDASLVDSHALGIFDVYGEAALRFSWGSQPYVVVSVGGFFPGFDPKPAKLPALRPVGMASSVPGGIIEVRAQGYFAVTSNSVQFGGRLQVRISTAIQATGFLEVDALVQFRPFHFLAKVAAGFDVSVDGWSFANVRLSGSISGPGPIVIQGSLSVSVFLFEFSWNQTFRIGEGPADALPPAPDLLDTVADELAKPESMGAADITDPDVILKPAPPSSQLALVPPTGALHVRQRVAPLGLVIERLHGQPLPGPQGVRIKDQGPDVLEGFAPGLFLTLSNAATLNRPAFEDLPAGKKITPTEPEPDSFPFVEEERSVRQITIRTGQTPTDVADAASIDLYALSAVVEAAGAEPAVSDKAAILTAVRELWTVPGTRRLFTSATAAHQEARYAGGVAVAVADLDQPVALAGIL